VAVAVGRRRLQTGPALRISPIPLASLGLSALLHGALIAGLMIAVHALHEAPQKVYVINLVPAIPAVGRPEGRGTTEAPPTTRPEPRPEPPTSIPPAPTGRAELPTRTQPAPPRDMPPREMPPRAPDAVGLPDRTLPPRSAAPVARRPDQKELPSVASATPPAPTPAPTAPTTSTAARDVGSPPPPAPAGLPSGSVHGKGKLSIDTDFPYAWYVKIIRDKIAERWDPNALPGQQPRVAFEISREGKVSVTRIVVRQSSGSRAYDQVAIRAIAEASPFPPLPDDFKNQLVTIDIQFRFEAERG
jgi:TonB family protein